MESTLISKCSPNSKRLGNTDLRIPTEVMVNYFPYFKAPGFFTLMFSRWNHELNCKQGYARLNTSVRHRLTLETFVRDAAKVQRSYLFIYLFLEWQPCHFCYGPVAVSTTIVFPNLDKVPYFHIY